MINSSVTFASQCAPPSLSRRENRADYATDEAYRRAMAARASAVAGALQSFASHLAASGRGFTGDSRAVALKTSLDISQLALRPKRQRLRREAGRGCRGYRWGAVFLTRQR